MRKYKLFLWFILLIIGLCWGTRWWLFLNWSSTSFPLSQKWQVDLGSSTYERPAYQDGQILFPTSGLVTSYWYGIESNSGQVGWSQNIRRDSYLRCLTPEYLVLSGPQSLLTLRTHSGEIIWQGERGETTTCSENLVFAVGNRGFVQAFDLATGQRRWAGINPDQPVYGLIYNPDMQELIAGGEAIIDPNSGRLLRFFERSAKGPPVEQGRGPMYLVDQNQLFLGETVLDARTGQVIHKEERYNGLLPPIVTTDTIYISTSQTRGVIALDRPTFEVKWIYEPQHWLPVKTVSPVATLNGIGYVIAGDVSLRAFDLTTGQELGYWRPGWSDLLRWSVCIPVIPGCMQPNRAGLATSENMLFVSFGDGKLYAFE